MKEFLLIAFSICAFIFGWVYSAHKREQKIIPQKIFAPYAQDTLFVSRTGDSIVLHEIKDHVFIYVVTDSKGNIKQIER